jgi:hypothetical protein
MKKLRFKNHKAGRGGWSEWVYPSTEENYLFQCCDCGLVHELQFKTFIELEKLKNKTFKIFPLPNIIRTMFKARRYEPKNTKKQKS